MSVPFLSRKPNQCAWIVADSAPPPTSRRQKIVPGPRVCGKEVIEGSSYCACHTVAARKPDQKPFRLHSEAQRQIEEDDERTKDLTEIFR